jgi:hypothetical protein
LDYFVINGFSDCKAYIYAYGGEKGMNAFTPKLSLLRRDLPQPQNFTSPYTMALVIFAEKGGESTWAENPVQHQYRVDWDRYEQNLAIIERSKRPELARSLSKCFIENNEYFYVDGQGNKADARIS